MKSKRFRPQKILSFFWESATISSLSPALRPGHHSPVVFAEAMRRGQKCPLVLFRHARNGWPPQTRGMKSTSFSYGAGNNWHRWEEGESDHYVPPNDLTGDRIRGLHRTSCWAIYLRIIQVTTMRVFACRIRNFKGGKKNVQAMKSLEDMRMFVWRTKVAQTMNWRIAKKNNETAAKRDSFSNFISNRCRFPRRPRESTAAKPSAFDCLDTWQQSNQGSSVLQ